jgi:hypothetical protein
LIVEIGDMEKAGCLIGFLKHLFDSKAVDPSKTAIVETESPTEGPIPYKGRDYFFSAAERSFYEVLRTAAPAECHIFSKVRLMDLVYIPKGTAKRQSWQSRVIQKHVDFVLCIQPNLRPTLVIELDDSTHDAEDRQDRDTFVDSVLAASSIPILRVPARHSYSVAELSGEIKKLTKSPG